jgi:cyclohexadieny/prephenate dehydrogenase
MAGSSPKLWHTILEQNRDEVLQALRGFQGELARFEQALANKDWDAVVAILSQGKDYRTGIR